MTALVIEHSKVLYNSILCDFIEDPTRSIILVNSRTSGKRHYVTPVFQAIKKRNLDKRLIFCSDALVHLLTITLNFEKPDTPRSWQKFISIITEADIIYIVGKSFAFLRRIWGWILDLVVLFSPPWHFK